MRAYKSRSDQQWLTGNIVLNDQRNFELVANDFFEACLTLNRRFPSLPKLLH